MRVVIVTNIPAPYRIGAWNKVAEELKDNFLIIFCAPTEPNRKWNLPEMRFRHVFLKENFQTKKDNSTFVHNNKDVWKHLTAFNPDVVITGGFNPTMLYAFAYTLINRKKHVPISDAWELSEKHLSVAHKVLRKVVFKLSQAFLACSLKGEAYYKSYDCKSESIFISHYAITNAISNYNKHFNDRKYDLLFSGQFTERKLPLFFIEVAKLVKQVKPDLKVLLLGDGPLREKMIAELHSANIDFDYPGYARQEELPYYYSNSRLFLFPTVYDAWGVVANEAAMTGTPVLVTPYAGCADELVINEINGFVLPLEEKKWVDACIDLLKNKQTWCNFSENARRQAAEFTHSKAADTLLQACEYAYNS